MTQALTLTEETLQGQQSEAFYKILDWWRMGSQRKSQRFVLAGYAGTGKTSLARVVEARVGGVLFLAYTGKAVQVLKDKGCKRVSTIHSAIYQLSQKDQKELTRLETEVTNARLSGVPESALVTTLGKIAKLKDKLHNPQFEKKILATAEQRGFFESETYDPNDPFVGVRLIVVDEYSMLDKKIVHDLEELGFPILYLGDPFQLPPVQDGGCPLEGREDYTLTEIHRQAQGDPILDAATAVREGRPLVMGDYGSFKYVSATHYLAGFDPEPFYSTANQIIVGTNRTKHNINSTMRARRGYEGVLPRMMEKVICLKNNRDMGLFNGMMEHVAEDAAKPFPHAHFYNMALSNNPDLVFNIWEGDLTGERYNFLDQKINYLDRFDYAYAVTCHKSQGSEYDNVLIFEERTRHQSDLDFRRWLYTAITRGKKSVVLLK